MGESWAYAHERYCSYTKFGELDSSGYSQWFASSIDVLENLMINNILTPKEIFLCLSPAVKSIDNLEQKLLEKYEDKSEEIEAYF